MSKKAVYSVLIASDGLDLKADRSTIVGCKKFIDQIKKVGYINGYAFIKSKESGLVISQIKLNEND